MQINAENGGVAAYHIGSVILKGVSDAKGSTEVMPIEATVGIDAPFIGRKTQARRIHELLCATDDPGGTLVVVSGPPGVGKTALLQQVAKAAHGGGQFVTALVADMRGYDADAGNQVRPSSVLSQLLLRLGVRDADIPLDYAEQLLMYRSRLNRLASESQPVLLWLDNVSDKAQFDSLQPTDLMHKLLLSTRETFGHVPQRQVIDLPVLSPSEASELLTATVKYRSPKDVRFEEEPAMGAAIATLCNHLPLALQIVVALATDEPDRPLAELVSELAHEESRLDSLEYSSDLSVRAAFSLSYRRLPLNLQRLFRLLSVVPGGDVGLRTASLLTSESPNEVRPNLMALVRSHLVQQHVLNRWSMHDLIRLYSSELSAAEPDDQRRAFSSVIHGYRNDLAAADEWLTAAASRAAREIFTSPEGASAWFEAERQTAIALVMGGAQMPDQRERALSIIPSLGRLLKSQHHWLSDLHNVAELGVSLVPHTKNMALKGTVLSMYGSTLRMMRDFDKALEFLNQALDVAKEIGDVASIAMLITNIANVLLSEGRIEDAIALYKEDLRFQRELSTPDPAKEAVALTNLGGAYAMIGRHSDAVRPLREAIVIWHRLDHMPGFADTATNLGGVLETLGRLQSDTRLLHEAITLLKSAIKIHEQRGNKSGVANVATNLGLAQCAIGQIDEGVANLERALDYFEKSGQTARVESLREELKKYRQGDQHQ
ncbi:tetratricopeptide repeat protein [Mycobacteroides abscessus]|uniref:tetratricopeptide repeat protein n=1 Tax=Mycobacteroides abscessus TaxID=36809 RepID=UPI0002DCFEFB|nr:tetratricopeptide repeat protein [Mycobacteroides abscessus]